ncbi:TetR/AcrR family transcriptional regulator [Amycolatopsis jiangsuensis]|uniref:AcrR family transcriptional regulator n=1 Tax=Amycolatopsis jiangsuensis TaxID=1181879 RepID=A0A840IX08_9PSEU|nr:TetR/AcrR family transcriptional regulator [Amycolatopsis jiangsuensis]MBB4685742.1 AcrR family transcriptional regulator [Amycolatopsis jiangsuensis]
MDPRKQRTLDRLLSAAEQLFRDRSVDEVTVEEIAERAGVAVGSLYNNFGSKAGLHAALVERALEADRQHMDRAYTGTRTPLAQIYAAAEEYLQLYLDHPEYFRMLAFPRDPGHYPAGRELAERLAVTVDEQNRRLVDALVRGIDSGQLRRVDPRETATVLWAAWNGIISLGWRPDGLRQDEPQLRKLLAAATDVVAHGLLHRPEPAADDPAN